MSPSISDRVPESGTLISATNSRSNISRSSSDRSVANTEINGGIAFNSRVAYSVARRASSELSFHAQSGRL
jgi:hypothetical protein